MDMPSFFMEALERFPAGKRDEIAKVVSAVERVHRFVGDFQNALSLFDFAAGQWMSWEERRKEISAALDAASSDVDETKQLFDQIHEVNQNQQVFSAWKGIAARDAAMMVFHFGKQFRVANDAVCTCSDIDVSKATPFLKTAGEMFRDEFPFNERIRHAVGHLAENQNDPRHVFSGSYEDEYIRMASGSLFLGAVLMDRFLAVTFRVKGDTEAKIYRYEISERTLGILRGVIAQLVGGVLAGCPAAAPHGP